MLTIFIESPIGIVLLMAVIVSVTLKNAIYYAGTA